MGPNLENALENLRKRLESEEGKKYFKEYFDKIEKKEKMLENQLNRFHSKYSDSSSFVNFIDKVISKYESDSYKDRWYNRGIEPPNNLYWFLYEYCNKFGRKCTFSEYKKHSNCFTSYLGNIKGYYIRRMDGQGSVIDVIKE